MSHLRRRVVGATMAMLGSLGVLAAVPSPAAAQSPAQECEVGAPIVNVSFRFLNEQDLTSNGDVWALDTGLSRWRLYRTGADTFCSTSADVGSFTAFAGPSPAGTGTVPPGHRGHFAGKAERHYVGRTFTPTLPTRGFVGTFDAQCDQFDCQNPTRFGRNYLEGDVPPLFGEFRVVYTSRCGVWIQTSSGDRGDIACRR